MKRYFKQVPASKLDIGVWYQKGFENNGIIYSPPDEDHRSEAIGAQCGYCNTIVWLTGRNNEPVLDEKKPENIPDSGPTYRQYVQNKFKRFLASLPPCPHCHQQAYDLFINNVVVPRYQNGERCDLKTDIGVNKELSATVKDILVWWYGDDAEAQRLGL